MLRKTICLLLLPFGLLAQSLPDSTAKKIDKLFSNYTSRTPGFAIAITQHGQVVFKNGYGMANLEYDIPITPSTIFHIASLSKQVVAFSILLLEKDGKLSLEDDIRKYLDFVPDFGKKITIQQLINHTSGLRDQWQLLAIAGWQLDDVIKQEHIIKLIASQKGLNADPGEEYNYCNTGYTLLGEIVKKVSGLSLRQYCDKNIFQPLEMKNTHFHDDYQELVKNRAYSYYPGPKSTYKHSVLSYSTVGATSLFTSVEDEAKWLLNFSTGKVGGKALIEKMYTTGVLNSGKKLDYAFGLVVNDYKGYRQISHGGADAGYRTNISYFPEADLGIVVFSNHSNGGPSIYSDMVANMILPKKETPETSLSPETADSSFLNKLIGDYYAYNGDRIGFKLDKGKFLIKTFSPVKTASELTLYKTDDSTYESMGLTFHFRKPGNREVMNAFDITNMNGRKTFHRLPDPLPPPVLSDFTGRYYNDETESYYTIVSKNDTLILQHRKYEDTPLETIAPDQFKTGYWWMYHMRFLRDMKDRVTGFEINSGRIQHLHFKKIGK